MCIILQHTNEKKSKTYDIISMGIDPNGRIVLTFLNKDMEVRGDFYPPMAGGFPLTSEYIKQFLEASSVVYGLRDDEIQAAYKRCIANDEIVKDVLVAQGDLPVNEVLEYMQINPLLGSFTAVHKKDGTVEHRSRSPFIIVKNGQAIAKQKSRKPGKDGKTVKGNIIAFAVTRPEGVTPGENTRMDGRFLLSCINGQMVVENKVVSVRDYLLIKGSINYSTGDIIFPGDVEIHGTVSDGFKIYSGGSILIKQTFDVTEAITKENLTVVGGIIGRAQALVKVGGALRTKFIQNCRVACRNGIKVELEITNSNVFTLKKIEMGEKGRIIGGEVWAIDGIRTAGIGRKTGKAARIHCGVDFTREQEKEKYNNFLMVVSSKIARLKEIMEDPSAAGAKKEKMENILRKLEGDRKKAQAKVTDLLGKINTNLDATVEVTGEIVQGTLIEICRTALYVTEPLKNVRVKLDKENNKLITESLQSTTTPP